MSAGSGTEKKEWQLGVPRVAKGRQHWDVDVIRADDQQIVMTITLNPETLPPRFKEEKGKKNKGKKVKAWELPESGTNLTLGFYETERVISLFREKRKQAKKERATKQKRFEPAAETIVKCWQKCLLRHLFAHLRSCCHQPICYSTQELLRIRCTSIESATVEGERASSFRVEQIPDTIRRRPGGVEDATFAFSHMRPAQISLFSSPIASISSPASRLPPPPGLVDPQLSQSQQPSAAGNIFSSSPIIVDARDIENSALEAARIKEVWKQQWKEQILTNLEVLAEKAWQQVHG